MTATTNHDHIEQSMQSGWQLPAELYADPTYYALERARIFDHAWQYVCRADQLQNAGDFVTTTLGDTPVVITRDREGALRGHVNVCLHRLHPVAEGAGCKKILQCRYHGWTYGLDGALKSAPRSQQEPDFDKSSMKLRNVSVGMLGDLVFANPDPDAAPLLEYAAPAPDLLEKLEIGLDKWEHTGTFAYDVPANWKLFTENALECYHCALVHNTTYGNAFDTDSESYICDNYEHVATQVAPVAHAPSSEGRPADSLAGFRMLFVWPSTFVSVDDYAGTVARVQPTGPQSCRFVVDTFARPGVDKAILDEWLSMYDATFAEDKIVVAGQQAGYNSGRVAQGRLMTTSESSIAMFQRRTWRAIHSEAERT